MGGVAPPAPKEPARRAIVAEGEEVGLPWGRRDLLAIGSLLGLCLIFFWPLLTPDAAQRQYIVSGDFTEQFYPYHYFAAAEWWARRIPLWNPYMFGGHPFQADIQTAVFYPPALAVNLLAGRDGLPFEALEWQGVVDYVLAAVFSYLFLRTVTGDRLAAVLGATTFALGGYLTSYPLQQLAVLETSIWLPLILLLLELGVRQPQRLLRWYATAGLAMALALLAGHPQSALFTAYTALAYLLFRSWTTRLPWGHALIGGLAFGLVAAGGAAVQLLPTMELTALSTRAAIPYDVAATGYEYAALPGLLMPAWRGEKALYLGVAPLLLAIVAIRGGPNRQVWFWGGVALVALALSFGDRGLLYRLFHALAPGFATFKGQERSAFIFSFAGAVLACYGLAALRRGHSVVGGRGLAIVGLVLAVGGALGVALLWPRNDMVSGTSDAARVGYPQFLVLLALAAALCWLARRGTGRGGGSLETREPNSLASFSARERGWGQLATMLALVALSAADVLGANWHNNLSPSNPAVSEAQLAAVSFLKVQEQREGEPLRVRPQNDAALPANYGAIASLPLVAGNSPIVVQRTQELFSSPEEWRLWQLLNVKYVVSFGQPSEALEEIFTAPPLKVYRNRFSLPRAWVVEDVQIARNAREAKELVLARDFHPGRTAVIEGPLRLSPRPADANEEPLRQQITFDYYSPRRLYLHVTTNRPGLLVVSESYYPGWQAKLDGAPVAVHRADYILRGVELPAGEHQLEMVYNPPSFWLGLAVSMATLSGMAGAWLPAWWRWRGVGKTDRT